MLATRSMTDFASKVAYQLLSFPELHNKSYAKDFIGKMRCVKFADGEMEVEILSSLRGKDVFLIAGAGRNSQGIPLDENKMELYHAVDAIKRSDAGRITLVEPFFSSSRSDRTTRRNSVGFWVHTKTLISLGVDHIITFQLHSDKSRSAIDPLLCAIDDVPATPLVKEFIASQFIGDQENLRNHVRSNWAFCSVDAGGEKLAKKYAEAFGAPLVIAHKQRDYNQQNTVESIRILSDIALEGKEIWIVDDMIDTAGSVYALVKELKNRKVAKVNIAIVHAVFSDPAIKRLNQLYQEGLLNNVVATDSIEITDYVRSQMPYLHVVSAAKLAAELIMRVHQQKSLTPFFDDFDVDNYFGGLKLFF